MNRMRCLPFLASLLALLAAGALHAFVEPDVDSALAEKEVRRAGVEISAVHRGVDALPQSEMSAARERVRRLGAAEATARVDVRSGRFAALLPATPLLPGRGVGNRLQWRDVAGLVPQTAEDRRQIAWSAFESYLADHRLDLGIDLAELGDDSKVTVYGDSLYQIHAPRVIDGIPVRDSYVSAVINHGNLVLLSLHTWGDLRRANPPSGLGRSLDTDQARLAAEGHLAPFDVAREWGKPELLYLPVANDKGRDVAVGDGYRYALVWSVKVQLDGERGRWEVLVDAETGDIWSAADRNHYVEAKGGVLPVTNDGIVPDGVEQPGWPMPFLSVSGDVTDTGGNYASSGSVTATLSGPYVRMSDNCGSISLTQSGGIDFGQSAGTDCTTPGFGGPGNTHASRTGFYELNKLIEMAQGQLPSNGWLQNQLTSNMNINSTCNAFWNGSTINFYRSGGGCANTGEIAGVFDHEWGHGMDDNDANPSIASPSGEGIADIYTALRLDSSCIGRNFRTTVCSGFGDPCLTCTGVRDIDYLKRQSQQPHDYTWANANCGSSVHCLGGTYSEAVWSLWKRKLQQAPYNYDDNTAHEIVTRLTFIGGGNVGTWFSGGPPFGGCGGTGGYLNYLAADDDNGNINDGTPHMGAIFAAFDDQEIACDTPTVQDSGCAGTPTVAPTVSASAGNQLIGLSWGAVAGASSYEVFRTEGVFACDFGKVKLGETTGTTWNDTGLQNGRDYSYVVIPKGPSASCFGPASACTAAQPVGQPDFSVACSPASQNIQQGASGGATCTVASSFGYSGSVTLSCSGNPAGVGCSFAPATVSVPADGTVASTLTIAVDLAQSPGALAFAVEATDGTITRTDGLDVLVVPEGSNGPQTAVYSSSLGAPACLTPGSSCDSGSLLDGRANLGPEPNQPNTLDGCTDGTSGTYHSDESNDRIVVRSLDGFDFVEGATVEIEATVWAWNTGSSDTLDLYHADDASSPTWSYIGSLSPPGGGAQTLSTQLTLPAGGLQAVRASFRYQGSVAACSSGNYDDADDLVFAVGAAGPECAVDSDCDDGLFCNGVESCSGGGSCQAGTPVICNDGVACTVDTCDEAADTCTSAPDDLFCDNGLFCDGTETCDPFLGCQAGAGDPCPFGELCDELNDVCQGACTAAGGACTDNGDCCSNKCRGPRGGKTCR